MQYHKFDMYVSYLDLTFNKDNTVWIYKGLRSGAYLLNS